MHIQEFDFTLPEALIAQTPVAGARDQSRLLVVDRKQQGISHHHFFELPHFLRRGDVLVLNNSKVFPARLFGKKKKTGGRIEVLFLRSASSAQEQWEVLIGGATVRPGTMLEFEGGLKAEILERMSDKTWRIQLNKQGKEFIAYRDQFGHTPIPPYIQHNQSKETELRKQYQTVYAQQEGSVAAPTAGLHFSEELLQHLQDLGVHIVYVTLHVGLGTFLPVKVEDTNKHQMHAEYAIVSSETTRTINEAKQQGRRIIAVGTTSVRTLESFSQNGHVQPGEKWTNIFITPGYQFQCVDGMITNFHLPKSTLFMLVCSFAGTEFMKRAYAEAIENQYRFYSFGDGMLIV